MVGAGGDVGEVEAFDDPDFGAEHNLMGFDDVFAVAADAKVVDADGADLVVDEVAGGVLADGDEVGVEVVEGPAVGGVGGFEEEAFAGLEVVGGEVGGGDLAGDVGEVEDATGADDGIEGELVHGFAVRDEVAGGVHVGGGVGGEVEVGEVAGGAVVHADGLVDEAGGIAGPGGHVVTEGGGDVDPVHFGFRFAVLGSQFLVGECRVERGRGSFDRIYKIVRIDRIFWGGIGC